MNCKKSLISNTVCERRHLTLFSNWHVSWNALYLHIKFKFKTFMKCEIKFLFLSTLNIFEKFHKFYLLLAMNPVI